MVERSAFESAKNLVLNTARYTYNIAKFATCGALGGAVVGLLSKPTVIAPKVIEEYLPSVIGKTCLEIVSDGVSRLSKHVDLTYIAIPAFIAASVPLLGVALRATIVPMEIKNGRRVKNENPAANTVAGIVAIAATTGLTIAASHVTGIDHFDLCLRGVIVPGLVMYGGVPVLKEFYDTATSNPYENTAKHAPQPAAYSYRESRSSEAQPAAAFVQEKLHFFKA